MKKIVLLLAMGLIVPFAVWADDFENLVHGVAKKNLECEITLHINKREYIYSLASEDGFNIYEIARDKKTREIVSIDLVLLFLGERYDKPNLFTKVPDNQLYPVLKALLKEECPAEDEDEKGQFITTGEYI